MHESHKEQFVLSQLADDESHKIVHARTAFSRTFSWFYSVII